MLLPRVFIFLSFVTSAFAQDGGQLYSLYCSACHGEDGAGATGGTFPPLAGSPWVAGDPDRAVKIVLKGMHGPVTVLGQTYNLEMPPQGSVLADDQVAAILTFVRTSWGNQAAPVESETVKTLRAITASRSTPWTAEEILKLHPLPLEKTALKNVISKVYAGEWGTMPDFSTLTAENVEEEHDGILSLKNSKYEDHFARVWDAEFEAPEEGEYEFLLDADDEASIIIHGKSLLDIRGGGPMNGSRAKKEKITLTKGSHPFRVEFVEFTDQQGLAIAWRLVGTKSWKWLTDQTGGGTQTRDPILISPTADRPVIYRNFITGTSPRAIGVGFPGGLNLAWSADHLGPAFIWTGEFMDGAPRWIDRGTENSPPAGDQIVELLKNRTLPPSAKFRGYKLDALGNPTFSIQLDRHYLLDSWQAENGGLVRTLTLGTGASAIDLTIQENANPLIHVSATGGELRESNGKSQLRLLPGKPVVLTYRWK